MFLESIRIVPGIARVPNKPRIEQMKKKIVRPPPIPIALFDLLKMQEDKKQIPEIARMTLKFPSE